MMILHSMIIFTQRLNDRNGRFFCICWFFDLFYDLSSAVNKKSRSLVKNKVTECMMYFQYLLLVKTGTFIHGSCK